MKKSARVHKYAVKSVPVKKDMKCAKISKISLNNNGYHRENFIRRKYTVIYIIF
jgi:hypothetical protein